MVAFQSLNASILARIGGILLLLLVGCFLIYSHQHTLITQRVEQEASDMIVATLNMRLTNNVGVGVPPHVVQSIVNEAMRGTLLLIILSTLGFVAVGMMMFVTIRRHVLVQLRSIRAFAGEVAQGNWEAAPSGRFRYELMELKDALMRMVANLCTLNDDALRKGESRDALLKIFERLRGYTASHFANEEKLFKKHGYPETEEHGAAHKAFVGKVVEWEQAVSSGRAMVSMEIMRFLKQWLTGHVMGVDKRYAPFFKQKGLR